MIYLRMFSFSFGWGRNVCDMGLNELASSTGMGRNTIRRSIERLVKDRWIKLIEDYEAGQIARQWRVFSPWEKGLTPEPTHYLKTDESTGSELDPVQNEPGPKEPLTGSNLNPPTGSKLDTYKESIQRNLQRNSLSTLSERAQAYFSEIKPSGKREGEFQAFRELIGDYPEEQVWACVEHLGKNGALDGNSCFAPLAYLRKAMTEVWAAIEKHQTMEQVREAIREQESARHREQLAQEEREAKEWEEINAAFAKAFPGEERQQEVIGELVRGLKLPFRGEGARVLAVRAWWEGLTD